ncbi:hypothetical protein ACJXXO_25430 (plasmid) [Enterobacter hormaechei]
MGYHPDRKAKDTTRYGLRRALRAGAFPEDPEQHLFGSAEKRRLIVAG